MPTAIYYPNEVERKLEDLARKLADDASIAFMNRDYTVEDVMRLLVETLALMRDTLEALRRRREGSRRL